MELTHQLVRLRDESKILNPNFVEAPTVEEIAQGGIHQKRDSVLHYSKDIFFSTGQVLAPVKFYVAKDLPQRKFIHREILLSLYPMIFNPFASMEYNLFGQLLATYNTEECKNL